MTDTDCKAEREWVGGGERERVGAERVRGEGKRESGSRESGGRGTEREWEPRERERGVGGERARR